MYAQDIGLGLRALVSPLSVLAPKPEDLVLVHFGVEFDIKEFLRKMPCHKGLVLNPLNIDEDGWGRAVLSELVDDVEVALGSSVLDVSELREAGFRNVHPLPLFAEKERILSCEPHLGMMRTLECLHPFLGAIVPGSSTEEILSLFREVLALRPETSLVVVGKIPDRVLARHNLPEDKVVCLQRLSFAELVAFFREMSVFLAPSSLSLRAHGIAFLCDVPLLDMPPGESSRALAERAVELVEHRGAWKQVLEKQRALLPDCTPARAAQTLSRSLGLSARQPRVIRKSGSRPKVAFVVPRYGRELRGGATSHVRELTQRLAQEWDVTVLTSCAVDSQTWANALSEGVVPDGPVSVRRFPVAEQRRTGFFRMLSAALLRRPVGHLAEESWVASQGPVLTGLYEHLVHQRDFYDGFVFFNYFLAPTVWGLPLVADKAFLVPTAHDEPAFKLNVYQDIFELPRAILCNTLEEQKLIATQPHGIARTLVAGVGVQPPQVDPERVRARFGLRRPYFVYVGQLEEGKGIGGLLRDFSTLRARDPDLPDLVLVGGADMPLTGVGVRYLGALDEQEKFDVIAGAEAAFIPSRFESLSLLFLEATSVGTPVIGHARSPIVSGLIQRSGAGVVYRDAKSLLAAMRTVRREREAMRTAGKAFAAVHTWESVLQVYRDELASLMNEAPAPSPD